MRRIYIKPMEEQVVKSGRTFARILMVAIRIFVVSFLVATMYYLVVAALYDTPEERSIMEENRILAAEYEELRERGAVLDDVIDGITSRDRLIYKDVFKSEIPDYIVNAVTNSNLDFSEIESETQKSIEGRINEKIIRSESVAAAVSASMDSIAGKMETQPQIFRKIPSICPVKGFSVGQTGASLGMKYNPFFKTLRLHTGLDIMAQEGTEIVAPADALVTLVKKNNRGDGSVLVLTHADGVQTVYKHLGTILTGMGRIVRRGTPIATVGMSGRSFAPHLHYEVIKDGYYMDPVNYFFASDLDVVSREKMMLLAITAGQSMD